MKRLDRSRVPIRRIACRLLGTAAVCAAFAGTARANLLTNGGFETGDLGGWTLVDPSAQSGAVCDVVPTAEGRCAAFLGAVGADARLSQSFATQVGGHYAFQFSVLFDGTTPSDFAAFVNGLSIFSVVNPAQANGFLNVTSFFTATAALSSVAFAARADNGFTFLDAVSVAVPEPSTIGLAGIGAMAFALSLRPRDRRSVKGAAA